MEGNLSGLGPESIGKSLSVLQQDLARARAVAAATAPLHPDRVLQRDWPRVYEALVQTFFDRHRFGSTYVYEGRVLLEPRRERRNDAGYMLRGVTVALERATARWPERQDLAGLLDSALAAETRYQWQRRRQVAEIRQYLCRCWVNLLVERPERIFGR